MFPSLLGPAPSTVPKSDHMLPHRAGDPPDASGTVWIAAALRRLSRHAPGRSLGRAWWLGLAPLLLFVLVSAVESQTSWLQSKVLTHTASRIRYSVEPGSSPSLRFPTGGPYVRRLGYTSMATFVERLQTRGFHVEAQARWSPLALSLFDAGLFAIYPEKNQAAIGRA